MDRFLAKPVDAFEGDKKKHSHTGSGVQGIIP